MQSKGKLLVCALQHTFSLASQALSARISLSSLACETNIRGTYGIRVSNVKNESMRVDSKGMFFGRANLGMQNIKAMNSLAAAPLSFLPVSIFRTQF